MRQPAYVQQLAWRAVGLGVVKNNLALVAYVALDQRGEFADRDVVADADVDQRRLEAA